MSFSTDITVTRKGWKCLPSVRRLSSRHTYTLFVACRIESAVVRNSKHGMISFGSSVTQGLLAYCTVHALTHCKNNTGHVGSGPANEVAKVSFFYSVSTKKLHSVAPSSLNLLTYLLTPF